MVSKSILQKVRLKSFVMDYIEVVLEFWSSKLFKNTSEGITKILTLFKVIFQEFYLQKC